MFLDGLSVAQVEDFLGVTPHPEDWDASDTDSDWTEELESFEDELRHSQEVFQEIKQSAPVVPAFDPNLCSICLYEPEDPICIPGCGTILCRDCFCGYADYKVADVAHLFHKITTLKQHPKKRHVFQLKLEEIFGIPCPRYQCKYHVLKIKVIDALTQGKVTEKAERFCNLNRENRDRIMALQQEAQARAQARRARPACPSCAGPAKQGRRHRLLCSRCHVPYCACGIRHNNAISCAEYRARERRAAEEAAAAAEAARRAAAYAADGDFTGAVVQCPLCHAYGSRVSGCHYLTCTCGQPFCNLCGCPLNPAKHCLHFPSGPFSNLPCKGHKDAVPMINGMDWIPE